MKKVLFVGVMSAAFFVFADVCTVKMELQGRAPKKSRNLIAVLCYFCG